MGALKRLAHWFVAGTVAGLMITGWAHARHEAGVRELRERLDRPSWYAAPEHVTVALRVVSDSVEADVRWTPAASWREGDSVRVSGNLGAVFGTAVDTALSPGAGSVVLRRPFDPGAGQFICASFTQTVTVIRTWGPGRAVHGALAQWQGDLKVRGPSWSEGYASYCAGHDLTYSGTGSLAPAAVDGLTATAVIRPPE